MKTFIRAVVLSCAVFVVHGQTLDVRTVGVAGRSNEHVSIASLGNDVALAWAVGAESGTDIYAAFSRDGGAVFSSPVRVNDRPGTANVGGEQPPRVVLVPAPGTPHLVVVWTAKRTEGTRLLSARSSDGGRTFAPAVVVPGSDAAGNRGWESVAVARDGRVLALWLDHRKLAGESSPMAHEHGAQAAPSASSPARPSARPPALVPQDPVARAGLSQLFFGAIDGRPAARAIAAGVCYCCKTSLMADGRGGVIAVWRHVYASNERDIAFAMSRDGGATFAPPVRVSRDGWQLDGCPENGPAVAVDAQRTIHVVWPTLVRDGGTETLALFYSASRDGVRFSPRARISGAQAAYHPQLVVDARGTLTVTWDEVSPQGRRIAITKGVANRAGQMTFTRLPALDAQPGVYPVVATTSAGTTIAWVRRGASSSTLAVARLP